MTEPLPKIDIRPDHWEIVRKILQKHVPQYEVWAFGSRAKWTAKEYSDLDLAIIAETPLPLDLSASLSDEFSESDLPWKVDIVDWATTSESFRRIIERDRVVVQRGWIDGTLGDCIYLQSGGTPSKVRTDYWGGSIPWVSAKDMKSFFLDDSQDHLTETGATAATRVVESGTTLLLVRGMTLHNDIPICLTRKFVAFNQDVKAVLPKKNILQEFVPYLILGNKSRLLSVIDSAGHGTGRLNTDTLLSLPVHIPPRSGQRTIAHILGALDSKIDLNRRINQTLEAMAQAIFKSWFVDFDPVKAKIAAKQQGRDPLRAAMSAISGKPDAELDALPREQFDPLAATATLFPEEMDESELGEIPRGWRISTLGEECAYLNRGISPKYIEKDGVLVLNQKCIRDFSLDPSKGRRHDPIQRSVSGRLLQVGDVLVNSTGVGTLGRVAQVLRLDEPMIVDSHVTVVRAGSHLNSAFLGQWFALRQPDIEVMGEGSTGQTELSRGKLANMSMVVPDSSVLGAFDAAVKPLKSLISARDRESLALQETRDALLPRLLSGELSFLAVLEDSEA